MSPPTPPPTEHETRANSVAPEATQPSEIPAETPATETEASANTSAPLAIPASLSQSSRPDAYQQYFPSIQSAATQNRLGEVIRLGESADLAVENERSPTRLLAVVPLVIAYLTVDDISPARHVLMRLPESLTSMPLIHVLHSLLASVRERKHANVYSRTEALHQAALQPDFLDPALGNLIALMLGSFVRAFRDRTFILLSRAYTSLSVNLAVTYLGMPAEELLPLVKEYNWTYDATNQVLTPAPRSRVATNGQTGPSSLAAFSAMADSVGRLEL